MKVLFNKVDMDTCLTALILGVSAKDELVAISGDASPEDLADPNVLCIEAGGSGQVERNNFDHHDPDGPSAPACEQAFAVKGGDDVLRRLVNYVSIVDSTGGAGKFEKTQPPYLSNIFSGMLLSTPEPVEQLLEGMKLLSTVISEKIDPFGTILPREEWQEYLKAYESHAKRADSVRAMVKPFSTRSGLKGGFVETDFMGAVGLIYGLGYEIAVVCHPCYGSSRVRKFTIAGNDIRVAHLLPIFNKLESGWGGPSTGTIIGSSRNGSKLTLQEVVEALIQNI